MGYRQDYQESPPIRMEQEYVCWLHANTVPIYDCDSVVELQLEFGEYAKITEQQNACDFYVWPRKPGSYYTESQIDSLFIQGNDEVCDSMVYLNLTLGQSYELEGEPITECSGFVWHGVPYYADAIVYDSLQTVGTHCDSIIAHQLTIIPSIEKDTSMVSCQPVWWNGHYFEEDGDEYTHVYTSQFGCDSIVTMHFNLSEQIEYEFDTLACESFVWYGNTCSGSGQYYSHLFQTPQGCDSLVTIHVNMNVPEYYTQIRSVCDSVEIDGVMYNTIGNYYVYYDTVYSQNGCDSLIYRINLTVNNSESIGVIEGAHDVYVASNLISGIYRYDIDTTGLNSNVEWSISNPEWQIVESHDTYCLMLVSTPGSAVLMASFSTSSCGEMERQIAINAGFFGIDEYGVEVNVYPNPTKGTLTIEAEGIESIRLTNMMGQVLEMRDCGRSDSVVLNLNGYAPSVYLLEIKTDSGTVKKRVVLYR